MSQNPPLAGIGFAWFRAEDYAQLRAMFLDAERFPSTFEEWRRRAEKQLAELTARGHRIEKVYLDPKTFPDWCRARGLDIDSEARRLFAAEAVRPKE